jgi:hypothetical protein
MTVESQSGVRTHEKHSELASAEARMQLYIDERISREPSADVRTSDFFEQHATVRIAEGIARAAVSEVLRRNGSTKEAQASHAHPGRTEQTLELYKRDPSAELVNPADPEYKAKLEESVTEKIKTALLSIDSKERKHFLECLGVLYPELVKCLVLDDSYIDRVYEPHFDTVFDIALDWVMHPEEMDSTHIRVGFGGNQIVGNRIPAYVVGAFRTVEQIHDLYNKFTNWALINSLHDEIRDKELSQQASNLIGEALLEYDRSENGSKLHAAMEVPSAQLAVVMEIDNVGGKHVIPCEVTRGIVSKVYEQMTGSPPDMSMLSQEYRFSSKYPKIVVFNGANAAIYVNKMSRDQVVNTRDATQFFLRKYAEMFHPAVSDALVFQNDTDWTHHSVHSRMLLQYAAYLGRINPELMAQVSDKLAGFEEHHTLDGHLLVRGMPSYLAYAHIHPLIFMDGTTERDWAEKIPMHDAVDPVDAPKYTIYHQGRPERIFGVSRKIYSESATLSGYVDFLRNIQVALDVHTGDFHSVVWQNAQSLCDKANEKAPDNKKKPLNGFLVQAAANIVKNSPFKLEVLNYLKSEAFKTAEDSWVAWQDFCVQLRAQLPKEDPQELGDLIYALTLHQNDVVAFKKALTVARDKGERSHVAVLETHPIARMVSSQLGAVECQVRVGEVPVYYPVEGVDTEIYPTTALPCIDRYRTELEKVTKIEKRTTGTIRFLGKRLGELIEAADISETGYELNDSSAPLVDEVVSQVATNIGNQLVLWESLESNGQLKIEDVQVEFDASVEAVIATLTDRIDMGVGLRGLVLTKLYPQALKMVQERTALQMLTRKAGIQRALYDYKMILRDIDPDEAVAEQKYHLLIEEMNKYKKLDRRRIS